MLDKDEGDTRFSTSERLFHGWIEINTLPESYEDAFPRPDVTQGLSTPTASPTLVATASTRAETDADTIFDFTLLPVPNDGLVSLDKSEDQPAR